MTDSTNMQWDALWYNARIASMAPSDSAYGLSEHNAVGIRDDRIDWIGDHQQIPAAAVEKCRNTLDCEGKLVTPGLIDCHTHLVYGGDRSAEFEQRLKGASYADIARAGGGILSTVSATRAASEDELFASAAARLQGFMNEGVTTMEIKSGYGLNLDAELKTLRVARRLGEEFPVDIVTTFLGAHTTPPEFHDNDEGYIDLVCDNILPAVADENLADAVDAFCEGIAFSPQQVARVFDAAQQYQLPVKLHAEQLSDLKGAVMAASYGALSVDHIEYLAEEDVAKLAESNTTAVLLPAAFYFLGETQLPPISALRSHQVPMALASDCNPGSAPVGSLLLMLNMACMLFKLTPEEALAGVTRNAALALGLGDDTGTLEVGKQANMVLWRATGPAELSYRVGGNLCDKVMFRGSLR